MIWNFGLRDPSKSLMYLLFKKSWTLWCNADNCTFLSHVYTPYLDKYAVSRPCPIREVYLYSTNDASCNYCLHSHSTAIQHIALNKEYIWASFDRVDLQAVTVKQFMYFLNKKAALVPILPWTYFEPKKWFEDREPSNGFAPWFGEIE